MKWDELYERGVRIVSGIVQQKLSGSGIEEEALPSSEIEEEVQSDYGVVEETLPCSGTEEQAQSDSDIEQEEIEITEQLKNSDYLWQELERRDRYDYRLAYEKIKSIERRRQIRRIGIAVGTAASLLIASLLFVYQYNLSDEKIIEIADTTIKPGGQKAILTTSDGRTFLLGSEEINLNEENGTILMVDSEGISYNIKDSFSDSEDATILYNTLEIPRGGIYPTTLADGTKVWLNSETKLRYPVTFSGNIREVELIGEAYFDVVPDKEKPFIVRMESGDITVLGTRFNIKSYPDEEMMAATLLEGSIRFENEDHSNVMLMPGYQLLYNKKEESITEVKKVKAAIYTTWKDNQLEFENESLENIMRILSRWYDVRTVFENEDLKHLTFTGNLDKYEDIDTFFHLFEMGSDVRFIIKDKTVTIKDK